MVITNNLSREVKQCLTENILPFWLNKMQDTECGGWYGQMLADGTIVSDAPRGAILNARILWAFSAAYRVLGKTEYLDAATRTYEYICQHFVDCVYGGIYWSVDAEGRPLDCHKQFYAQGFMIYGLSEYCRALSTFNPSTSGDKREDALQLAIDLFNIIEEHSRDHLYGGYIESCTRDWQPVQDMRLSDKDANYPKSQNTHLHILEPYTNLHRVWPDARLKEALEHLLDVFCNRILNRQGYHLQMFFDMDWTPIPQQWESYGHDIEASWLMHEAALVLGDEQLLSEIEPIIRTIAHASEKGLRPDGSMIHEINVHTGLYDTERHWWVQAEAIVGFYNLYQHFGDEDDLRKAERLWQYVRDHLINYQLGEWYWSVDAEGKVNTNEDHAGFWKCPYHNTRMCLEIIERQLSPD